MDATQNTYRLTYSYRGTTGELVIDAFDVDEAADILTEECAEAGLDVSDIAITDCTTVK